MCHHSLACGLHCCCCCCCCCGCSMSSVNTSHTSTVECLRSQGNSWRLRRRERVFRRWCLKFHTRGASLHARANDWPCCSGVHAGMLPVYVWAGEITAGTVLSRSRRIRHAFQTTKCFPGSEPHKCFCIFCEAHQLFFYLGQTEIRCRGLMLR